MADYELECYQSWVTSERIEFNAIFNNASLYRGGQFDWWRKPEYPENTIDLSQVSCQTLSHNVVSSTPRHERELTTLVVMGTDCICSCKSKYYTITITMAPVSGES